MPERAPAPRPSAAQAALRITPHEEPELVAVRHRVAAGETVYRISLSYGLRPEELMAANGMSDPRTLAVGQELLIPGAQKAVRVAAAPDRDESEVRASPAPREAPSRVKGRATPASLSERPKVATQGLLEWPLRGVLYGRFGKKGREPHDGIDLAAPEGTPVRTARPGHVLYAGEQKGYGNIVIVDHGDSLVTLYAHNQDLRVKTGQQVRGGQVVATVGQSGKTSGPHLHFEVRRDGLPVDPLDFLGALPTQ
ncbi:M23 family metallopeptidase [Aggregicoccus sp. 17bor-14]|nr:M23 family metallopeptidase [Aggregicoccus sp. 17bor-14]